MYSSWLSLKALYFCLDNFQYEKLPKHLNYDMATTRRTMQPKKKQFDPSLLTKEERKID
jgi:hypothetical protein